ncbi:alpha/beta-hydrolase [Aspergillus pseudoustus]|uniref:Alpha/beta-hydrolase n=1 Tax=Aspergillus pseudoustus TaxID=1810923 RepID=A0ABR4JSB0_9EURO
MLPLSTDESFNFEILRTLSLARYQGSDICDVLQAVSRITAGDIESFHDAFNNLADRVVAQADSLNAAEHPVSARDYYFRVATYYRAADFYLHGNWDDPRIGTLWEKQTNAFNKAIALLPIPGERVVLKAEKFEIPAIFYRAGSGDDGVDRPTILAFNGYDGAQEELLHICGFAALDRGYNFITFEGPGQPSVRRNQNLGFIVDWESVVTPVVDYAISQPGIDPKKLALFGYSFGGFLAVRAAAFEHRLAAVAAVDGVFDFHQALTNMFPQALKDLIDTANVEMVDKVVIETSSSADTPVSSRWGMQQGLWSFNIRSPSAFFEMSKGFTLKDVASKVRCPVWVGEAEHDIFFKGQPQLVKEALGDLATLVRFTPEEAAAQHCHTGALVTMNQRVFDWFKPVLKW